MLINSTRSAHIPLIEYEASSYDGNNTERLTRRISQIGESIAKFHQNRTQKVDSIFEVDAPKVKILKLNSDSTSMGFLVFLKQEFIVKKDSKGIK